MYLRWQKKILSMIQERQDKKVALAIDTSTNDVPTDLIGLAVVFLILALIAYVLGARVLVAAMALSRR